MAATTCTTQHTQRYHPIIGCEGEALVTAELRGSLLEVAAWALHNNTFYQRKFDEACCFDTSDVFNWLKEGKPIEMSFSGDTLILLCTGTNMKIKLALPQGTVPVQDTTRLALEVASLRSEIQKLRNVKKCSWCIFYPGRTITGTAWQDIPLSCTLKCLSAVKVTIQFSALINPVYGGARIMMDGTTVFGKQPTYGLQWLAPQTGVWCHYNIARILEPITPGVHTFTVQLRAQNDGGTVQIHGGDADTQFCPASLFVENVE
ncbi:hypothetical protein Pelo_9047 [Pelomyxa schiedti]|nr:hypothetical protein Pelo_9047 [Pelomyxa schiedti]